jgi:putative oxidoreductase
MITDNNIVSNTVGLAKYFGVPAFTPPTHLARKGDDMVVPALVRYIDAPARVLMSLLFLISGVSKLTGVVATQAYMTAYGVPEILLWPAAAWEISAGVLLVMGLWTRPLAVLLTGWCLMTAFIFHTAFSDPVMLMMFLKNITMAGSFLLLAKIGASGLSVDGQLYLRRGGR